MIKFLKRIFFFLSVIILYYIFKEFVMLYVALKQIHPIIGYGFALLSFLAILYFVAIPIFRIIKMPHSYGPVKNKEKENDLIKKRLEIFKTNPYLIEQNYTFDLVSSKEDYQNVVKIFHKKAKQLRNTYVSQLFYTTAIAQNGFIDAILILSASVNLIKEIFTLFNGRVSSRDLLIIGKQVYFSMQ